MGVRNVRFRELKLPITMIHTIKKYLLESKRFQILFILSGILPLIVLGIITYVTVYQNGTKATLNRRESLGRSIAKLAEERFDFLVLEGIHYVSHPQFQQLVREKKWEEAISSLVAEQKPMYSTIDRFILFDVDSTARADYPHLPDFENLKGKQFTDRDWYRGVSRNWQPYITEIFQRITEPRINVISVVIPIKSILPEEKDKLLGILNLTIYLDNFYVWSRSLNTDPNSVLYFVDQKGQVVGNLNHSVEGEIADYANVPTVQKLLHGEEGVDILFNPVEKTESVSAYYKIGKYNWGVVAAQELSEAFLERDNQLRQIALFLIIFMIISASILYLLYRLFFLVNKYQYQEKILLESIGDGVFVINLDFRIILWNKAAGMITGLTPQEVIGKKCLDIFKFVHAKTHRDRTHLIQESIRKGEIKHLDSNTLMVINNGRKIPIGDSAAPIFSRSGKVEGAIVVFQDKTSEQDLNQAKDEFLSIAAHQLRTPLGIMRWNLEMLLKRKTSHLSQEVRLTLDDMYKNNLNLIKLVNDLLDVSRINQNRVTNKPQFTDILPLLKEILEERKKEIKAKKINLKIQVLKKKIPKIKVDPDLFRQVLRNLISNAIKYNRIKGSIGIEFKKGNKSLLFTIKDSGIGIPKKQQEKVFEKFSRADNAVSLGIAGTGLGLFVVKSYISLWRGKIWLESEKNKGTTVYFTIPYEKNSRRRRQ